MKKYFGNYEITYKKVIILAIITGVFTGVVSLISVLNNTSIQDIAIYPDVWFVFALFIIMNCKGYKEAAIKTFLFFLISQLLVYLVQVPFVSEGFGIFRHYIFWFEITVLTIPGSMIAYMIKKQNILSAIILSVCTGYLAYQSIVYLKQCIATFPYHLLSFIFCILTAIILTFILLDSKKLRIIGLSIFLVVLIASTFILNIYKKNDIETYELDNNNYSVYIDNEDVVDVEIENNILTFTSKKTGTAYVCLTDENNNKLEYYINVNGNEMFVSKVD